MARTLALALLLLPALVMADAPFRFGSYGRVGASTDGEGGRGRDSTIVPWGPRLTEGNYIELDFGYHAWRGPEADVVTLVTLALGDRFFHFDGDFDATTAIRQAYVEASSLLGSGGFLWVGSRMYRGDDIYLFDFWPMDELNTIGLAAGWRDGRTELVLHGGFNRLESDYQFQRTPVAAIDFGAEEVETLDRQRSVMSAKAERRWGGGGDTLGLKLRLYGELHYLPSGDRPVGGSLRTTEPLPDDRGWMLGAQVGLWSFAKRGHLNVWLRYASGLAAYDELAEPYGLDTDRRAVDAEEYRLAVAGNSEHGVLAMHYGAYVRAFVDADGQEEDFDDRQEMAVALRPTLLLGTFTPAMEASVQVSRPNGLNPRTNAQETARVWQLALVPALTFADDPGTYSRPQIRLIYAVSLLNDAALALYAAEDPRASQDVVHFVGARAEWWFGRGGGY